jgi:hypothetical protein
MSVLCARTCVTRSSASSHSAGQAGGHYSLGQQIGERMTAAGESNARQPAGQAEAEDLRLPRLQEGARPQHLIVTLFGDYWWDRTEHLPSAGLVALVGEFDISATSARAALSRLGRRGLLASSKIGRRTYYGPAPETEEVMRAGADRIFSFGAGDACPWDGTWLVVAFSVPEEQRDVRHALRMRLRWLGFAALYAASGSLRGPTPTRPRRPSAAAGSTRPASSGRPACTRPRNPGLGGTRCRPGTSTSCAGPTTTSSSGSSRSTSGSSAARSGPGRPWSSAPRSWTPGGRSRR